MRTAQIARLSGRFRRFPSPFLSMSHINFLPCPDAKNETAFTKQLSTIIVRTHELRVEFLMALLVGLVGFLDCHHYNSEEGAG